MPLKEESFRIAMALAQGRPVEREYLSPRELREVFHALVAAVGPNAAFVELALIDGREALVRFPRLSAQFVQVRSTNGIRRTDFDFLPDRGSVVWGADPRGFRSLLSGDLKRYWFVGPVVGALAVVALFAGRADEYIQSLSQLLAIASSLFFAVYVIFGIGQVVRPAVAHKLFESGSLQEGIDADRYCVRLTIGGFVLAMSAVAWHTLSAGTIGPLGQELGPLVADIVGLVLVSLAGLSVLLAMFATVDYLLVRSADLTLKQSALESFGPPVGDESGDSEPVAAPADHSEHRN